MLLLSFSDLVKRLITRNPLRKNRHPKRNFDSVSVTTAPASQSAAPFPEPAVTERNVTKPEEVNRQKAITIAPQKNITRQNALLLIVYQDIHNKLLFPSQIISGQLGEKLRMQFKVFPDYNLVRINGFTSYFASRYGIITLTYNKKDAGVIWILCRDIDTNFFLSDPYLIRGKVKEPFELYSPTLAGYNLIRVKGNLRGNFSYDQKFVTFYYRQSSWKDVRKVENYLKILGPLASYEQPQGKELNISFALNTVWRTFSSITMENGDLWYCLGGAIWIKFDPQKVVYSNKRAESTLLPAKASVEINNFKESREALVDFIPNGKVAAYDSPFGQKIGLFADKTKVVVTAQAINDGVTWFKLRQGAWIPRQYLKFL